MRIYTKSGDRGDTSLVHGMRVAKYDLRVEAYGTCDEANSNIGLALALLPQSDAWTAMRKVLHIVQTKLFHIGSELATPTGKQVGWPIEAEDVSYLEQQIDITEAILSSLRNFILPGGHPAAAALHVARTVVRRAERRAVQLQAQEEVNPIVIQYLNRLSDYLFVAARIINQQLGVHDSQLHEKE